MPNRILREGILTSQKLCKLGWADEVFYRRLMSVVDDFGRYHADPGMLRAACYPRQLSKVSDSDIEKWLRACVDAALVRVYPAEDGERYLELLNFCQQVRAKKSKFPDPHSTCIADATQPLANEHLDVFVSVDVSEGDNARKRATPPIPEGVDNQTWADWLALRKAKKAPVTATVIAAATAEAKKAGMTLEAFLRVWCARGSQGLQADWLRPGEGPSRAIPVAGGSAVPSAAETRAAQEADRSAPAVDPAKRRAAMEMALGAIKRVA